MSKEQLLLELCEKAFQFEEGRTERQNTKSEKIIAAVVIIMGLKLVNGTIIGSNAVSIAGLGILTISLVTSFSILLVVNYLSYPRKTELMDKLSKPEVTEAEVFRSVSFLYLEAKENNAKINDSRALIQKISSYSLLLGFVLLIVNQFLRQI